MTALAATITRPQAPSRRATVERIHDLAGASSEDLLVAVAGGDREAFAALYDRLVSSVFAVCRRVLRDPAMAEEVSQEVLVEVWKKAARFDPDRGSAAAWVTTLAHRRAVDRVRSEQASRDRDERVSQRDHRPAFDSVADEVEVRLEHWQVRQALADLTDRQREAIELAYYQGHTYRDVAKVLGIPEGTAKSRLRDGLARLRTALEDLA